MNASFFHRKKSIYNKLYIFLEQELCFNWTRNNKDTFLVIQAHTFFNKFKLVIFINFINDAAMISKAVLVDSKKCCVYLESYVLFLKFCQYQVNRKDRFTRLYVYLEIVYPFLSCINAILSWVYTVLSCVNTFYYVWSYLIVYLAKISFRVLYCYMSIWK